MSSSEEEDQFNEEQVKEIKRISNLRKKEFSERFLVSGWEDDTEGIEEELNPHGKPETEILWAAENGELNLVKNLVTLDEELLKVKDKDGYTPLHRACYNDHSQVVETCNGDLLVFFKIYLSVTSNCQKGNRTKASYLHFFQFLLSCGADFSAQTIDLWQPLHSACRWNSASSAAKLLDIGADINCKSMGGQTPLHLAASNGDAKETLQLLLMNPNIDSSLKNENNETAYDIALRSGKYAKLFEIVDPVINYI